VFGPAVYVAVVATSWKESVNIDWEHFVTRLVDVDDSAYS
jgi:hypothetical protein